MIDLRIRGRDHLFVGSGKNVELGVIAMVLGPEVYLYDPLPSHKGCHCSSGLVGHASTSFPTGQRLSVGNDHTPLAGSPARPAAVSVTTGSANVTTAETTSANWLGRRSSIALEGLGECFRGGWRYRWRWEWRRSGHGERAQSQGTAWRVGLARRSRSGRSRQAARRPSGRRPRRAR